MEATQARQGSLGPRSRSGGSTPPPTGPSDDTQEPLLQGGSSGAAEGGATKREPVALPCGHVFCETCIDEWMKSHPTCPICRKDPTRPDLPPGGGGGGNGGDDDSRRPPPPPTHQPDHHQDQQQQDPGGCCQAEQQEQQQSSSSRAEPSSSGGFFAPRRPYRRGMRMAAMDIGPELIFRLGSLRVRLPSLPRSLPPSVPSFLLSKGAPQKPPVRHLWRFPLPPPPSPPPPNLLSWGGALHSSTLLTPSHPPLQRRYPAYVTDDMVGRWTHDIHGDRHIRWRTDTEFVRRHGTPPPSPSPREFRDPQSFPSRPGLSDVSLLDRPPLVSSLRDPARVEATRSQGRSGASTSFGGGSSFGGGGRGGSW